MSRSIQGLSVFTIAAAAAFAPAAHAADDAAICSVAVDYLRNGVISDAYRRDFVVVEGADFVDDQSTSLRSKRFTAKLTRNGGETLVSVDYFDDVGVFFAVGFTTGLSIRGGGGAESTAGSHTSSISSGVTPVVVGGNHTTNHTLACRRL